MLWAGILAGVVLVAVPAQFAAPSLETTAGIDATRHVFLRFNQVELVLVAASALLAVVARTPRLTWILLTLVWLLVALQSLWLLPALDARATRLVAGEVLEPAPWHRLYGVLEMVKFLGLLAASWIAALLGGRPPDQGTR